MSTESSKVDGPTLYEDTCVVPFQCSYPYWQPIYFFNSPLQCRQSDLCIKTKSSYSHPTEWTHLLFFYIYFKSNVFFFKNFSIMKWRYMGSGSKAAVFLNWAELTSMLSSHRICAEDSVSPHCIEDCLDPRAGLGTVMKGIITSLACNWTPVAQPITSLLTDSLRSINFYSKIKSSFIHFVQLVRWPNTNQWTFPNARVSRSECDILGRTTFHKMQMLMDSTPPILKIHTYWTLNIYTVLG